MKTLKLISISIMLAFFVQSNGYAYGVIVVDPLKIIQIAKEIKDQAEYFTKELAQYKAEIEQLTKKNDYFNVESDFSQKKNDWLKNIWDVNLGYLAQFKNLRRRIDQNFQWEPIRMKEIEDILNHPMFRNTGGTDPYGGLFTQGTSLTDVFGDLNNTDSVLQSTRYKNNEGFRKLYDEWKNEEKRMMSDYELRKNALSKIAQMQIQSEERLKKFEKSMQEMTKTQGNASTVDTKYTTLSKYMVYSMEFKLEQNRQWLQQISVINMKVEMQILKRIREMYLDKLNALSEKEDSKKSLDRDVETAVQLVGSN